MKIHEILKITPEEYDMLLLEYWLKWCTQKSITEFELQLLLSNNAIHQWFSDELQFHEQEFVTRSAPFISASAKDLRLCYDSSCEMIFSTWPDAALKAMRKTTQSVKVPPLNYHPN